MSEEKGIEPVERVSDERDEAELGDLEVVAHRRNTAICVGVPTSSSTGPIPDTVTE